jgi:hypothetical protein
LYALPQFELRKIHFLTHNSLTAPALSAVEYELTKIDGVLDSVTPFTGPGPTVDAAWGRFLFNDTCMSRVSHYPTSIDAALLY